MEKPNTKLELARLQRRWSVEIASNKVGVSINTFNRWERGLQVPQLETLDLLCKAFEMSPEELGFEHVISAKRRGRLPQASSNTLTYEDSETRSLMTTNGSLSQRSGSTSADTHIHIEQRIGQRREQREEIKYGQRTKDSGEEISRRQAMTFLISTPATIFRLTSDRQSTLLHPDEVVSLSKVNIPLCWKLYFEGGFTELTQVLPGYLAQLGALAHNTSEYSQQAAGLASQLHQLAYLLALQSQDFGTALQHTHDAACYGQQAGDVNLRVTAMVRQAYIYFCLKRSAQRVYAYEEALRHSNGCSPLIQGYLYAGLAEAYANRKDKDAAQKMLQCAHNTFPERPEDDPNFAYTHFRWLTLHNLEGLVHLHLQQARQAWSCFDRVDRALAHAIVPHRVEVTVYQAATALQMGELEQSCSLLTIAVEAAVKLGSHLRYQEASRVYDRIQERWPQEQQVRTLQELFH